MEKWYTKPVIKKLLISVEVLLSVIIIGAVIVLGMFSGNYSDIDYVRMVNRDYVESTAFVNDFYEHTYDILSQVRREEMYEEDGKFNFDKVIDIITFTDVYGTPSIFKGENRFLGLQEDMQKDAAEGETEEVTSDKRKASIVVRVGDIIESNEYSKPVEVIVMEKPDGSYFYCTNMEFISTYAESGNYIFSTDSEYKDSDIKEHLRKYKRLPDGSIEVSVRDVNGTKIFNDCWNFSQPIRDEVHTIYGESLIDVVNNYPEFNGRLYEVYNLYDYSISSVRKDYDEYTAFKKKYSAGNTNYRYAFAGSDGRIITNDKDIKSEADVEKVFTNIRENEKTNSYVNVTPYLSEFETNLNLRADEWKELLTMNTEDDSCRFMAYIDSDFAIQDAFYNSAKDYNKIRVYVVTSIVLGILASILLIGVTILITLGAGRKYEDNEIHLLSFDRIKTEIAALIIIVPSYILFVIPRQHLIDPYNLVGDMVAVVCLIIFVIIMLMGYLSLVRRLKAGTMWNNSILKTFYEFVQKTWDNRSAVVKSFIVVAVLVFVNATAYIINRKETIIIATILNILFIIGSILYAIDVAKVKKGLKEISDGNLEYKIDEESVKGPLKETAVTINNIGVGMKTAVDEKIRSERLKTDLITNVSHDIKTPLTSIINYVDILKREDIQDEKIKGYIDILDEKSKRLKTLTEDVLEASKASSGNIKLICHKLDLLELIRQTAGEFEEKMGANNLSLVCTLPEDPAVIYADGRRMWRILENILNNAVKYSMKGTRVYLDVEKNEKEVEVVLKNISAYQLNIRADQLTERFVRGDVSRASEGTGLGLSISKSLTELQGGKFEIYLDGDLFKVIVSFPIYEEEAKETN